MINADDLKLYEDVKENLKFYKAKEAKLRKKIAADCNALIGSESDRISCLEESEKTGKLTFELFGYEISLTNSQTLTIDQDIIDVIDDLTEEERNCLDTKVSLSSAKYRDFLKEFDEMDYDLPSYITTKDGMPKLEVKEED